jgi:hypothetical protein
MMIFSSSIFQQTAWFHSSLQMNNMPYVCMYITPLLYPFIVHWW